jgi:hypothetical protein
MVKKIIRLLPEEEPPYEPAISSSLVWLIFGGLSITVKQNTGS